MTNTKYRLLVREEVINEYIIEADSGDEAIEKMLDGDTNEPKVVEYIDDDPEILECDLDTDA